MPSPEGNPETVAWRVGRLERRVDVAENDIVWMKRLAWLVLLSVLTNVGQVIVWLVTRYV